MNTHMVSVAAEFKEDRSAPTADKAGVILRRARDRMGLSLKDAAKQLHLMPSHIELLESGAVPTELRSKHFNRYTREYAKLLGLNPQLIIELLQQQIEAEYRSERARPSLTMAVAALIAIGFIGTQLTQPSTPSTVSDTASGTTAQATNAPLTLSSGSGSGSGAGAIDENLSSKQAKADGNADTQSGSGMVNSAAVGEGATPVVTIKETPTSVVSPTVASATALDNTTEAPAPLALDQQFASTEPTQEAGTNLETLAASTVIPTPIIDNDLLANIRERNTVQVKQLIDDGASVNAIDKRGTPALVEAVASGDAATVELILSRGARIEEKDRLGQTAMLVASIHGHKESIASLLRRGADVNARSKRQRTSLMAAAWNNHADLIPLLHQAGANILSENDEGWTALTHAVWQGHAEVVAQLIELGAMAKESVENQNLMLKMANERQHLEVAELLQNTQGEGS